MSLQLSHHCVYRWVRSYLSKRCESNCPINTIDTTLQIGAMIAAGGLVMTVLDRVLLLASDQISQICRIDYHCSVHGIFLDEALGDSSFS